MKSKFIKWCCIYSNKDKNFKANHNTIPKHARRKSVVSIVTKIRILKQITTRFKERTPLLLLYL